MKQRWIILFLLILAAIICYLIGSVAGLSFFIILGFVFELFFWVKLFRKNKS